MTSKALRIKWTDTVEFIPFDFDNLDSNTGIVYSLERWYKGEKIRWVKYSVMSTISRSDDAICFFLKYKKIAQTDPFVKKHSTWGTTTLTFDLIGKNWSASWSDDTDSSNNGPAEIDISEMPSIDASDVAISNDPDFPSNEMSVTKFLDSLGCTLRLGFYWSAKTEDDSRVIFTIWDDQIEDDRYMLLPHDDAAWSTLPGAYEVRRHVPIATTEGVEVFGMLCHAKDAEAATRVRAYYDEKSLLILSIEQEGSAVYARINGEISVERVREGRVTNEGAPRRDALWDTQDVPDGVENPERLIGVSSGFARDRMVRDHVIRRADGYCEYCGRPGFEMSEGRRYLEAHHVVALSSKGADTVQNVIALCPSDHREAHYGIRRDQMNREMQLKLETISSKVPAAQATIMRQEESR